MDVLVLIDKLDDLVHNAKAVPLTDQVRIDREEIYDILDQMRATIPEEIKQARWIVKERQEMLAEAKREQDRLLQEAREQAVREASQTEIVKLAERQAQEIIDEARRQAREMRLEMEDWADGMLATLETNLDKFLVAVRRGRERLHERSQEIRRRRHRPGRSLRQRLELLERSRRPVGVPPVRAVGVRVRGRVGLALDRGAEARSHVGGRVDDRAFLGACADHEQDARLVGGVHERVPRARRAVDEVPGLEPRTSSSRTAVQVPARIRNASSWVSAW